MSNDASEQSEHQSTRSQQPSTPSQHQSTQSQQQTTDFREVERTEPFVRLKRTHRSFVFPVAIGFLVWYFAYVLLADYAHEFMSTPVIGNINIGLLLGLGQFVTTFAITTWYVSYANRKLDPLAEEIRADLEASEGSRR